MNLLVFRFWCHYPVQIATPHRRSLVTMLRMKLTVWEKCGRFWGMKEGCSNVISCYIFVSCPKTYYLVRAIEISSRSQWPRRLRHQVSSLARTLGSWVRIPLKAWVSVLCAFILCCVVLYVGRGLATGWAPIQGDLPTVIRIKKLRKRK
jgi:hypothetical protein